MRWLVFLLSLSVPCMNAIAAQPERPVGLNCRLTTPPQSSGEEFNHGINLRIYPRARDITQTYSGCQIMFAPDAAKWVTVSIAEFKNGDPVRLWTPHGGNPELAACRYKNGQLISGVAATCPAPHLLIAKSLAPGCLKRIQDAVAMGGLGAARPRGCEYE
jgi:hypothetical protein